MLVENIIIAQGRMSYQKASAAANANKGDEDGRIGNSLEANSVYTISETGDAARSRLAHPARLPGKRRATIV